MQGAWAQSLVGELRSHMPHVLAEKKKKLYMSFPIKNSRGFPGGPVAKTLCSQCRGSGFNAGQESRSHITQLKRSYMPQLRFGAAKITTTELVDEIPQSRNH